MWAPIKLRKVFWRILDLQTTDSQGYYDLK
jgi:hypothetical protein